MRQQCPSQPLFATTQERQETTHGASSFDREETEPALIVQTSTQPKQYEVAVENAAPGYHANTNNSKSNMTTPAKRDLQSLKGTSTSTAK